jgi:hypothetical protein
MNAPPAPPEMLTPPSPDERRPCFIAIAQSNVVQENEIRLIHLASPVLTNNRLPLSRSKSRVRNCDDDESSRDVREGPSVNILPPVARVSRSERRRTDSAESMIRRTIFRLDRAIQHWAKPVQLKDNGQHKST